MIPIACMAGSSVATALLATAALGTANAAAIWLGMLGPLVVACGTWALMERTYRRDPQQLTAVMMAAFGAKALFFGAYLVLGLRGLSLPTVPFVASFTAYLVGLYTIEALFLKRLFG